MSLLGYNTKKSDLAYSSSVEEHILRPFIFWPVFLQHRKCSAVPRGTILVHLGLDSAKKALSEFNSLPCKSPLSLLLNSCPS